ncbi:Uncharacterised protein [Actinomadura madurae]|nr:Uncharacterised protein [Actinomadura madurae]
MDPVVPGINPHKRSATIEVMAADEAILGRGRYGTDRDGYAAMLRYARQWPDRVWAIEGCNGIGRHIANRLLADGEQVLDVPAKLSARRARVFATGQGRKTDATDAHSVATVRPRDAVGKARRRVAAELISDLERIYRRTAGRGRRHHPVPQPGALRLLERHGPHRCILRRPDPAPAVASRQPADQPGPAHHGHRPTPQPHRRTGLLRPQDSLGQNVDGSDAGPQMPPVRRRLPAHARRRAHAFGDGPGGTPGSGSRLQRGRLTSPCRHFGQATSRTRHHPPYDHPQHGLLTQRGAMTGRSPRPARLRSCCRGRVVLWLAGVASRGDRESGGAGGIW